MQDYIDNIHAAIISHFNVLEDDSVTELDEMAAIVAIAKVIAANAQSIAIMRKLVALAAAKPVNE